MERAVKEELFQYSKRLRLPAFRKDLEERLDQARSRALSYEAFLIELLAEECALREANQRNDHIRGAGFPQYKYLYDLERGDLPPEAAEKLTTLETLDFIKAGHNIILAGNPGTGKTHVAIGLGLKACQEGYKVLFTTVSKLLTLLRESRAERTLRQLENKFEKYDLVICDEFGYISFDKEGAELLFSHLSLRTGRKSTIITTNLSFDRWGEIFGDPVLTAAMVDRLTHKAYMIAMSGKSYRVKETKNWMKR